MIKVEILNIVITGASGFVGQNIVPMLAESNHNLLLVGRNKGKLQGLYPSIAITDYDNLAVAAKGFDCIVHLAAMVRDNGEEYSAFEEANINLLQKVADAALKACVPVFINLQTMGLYDNNYTKTKLLGEKILASYKSLHVVSIVLPAVVGKEFNGKLYFLNFVPKVLQEVLFKLLSSLRPTVHTNNIARAIEGLQKSKQDVKLILSDRQKGNWFFAFIKRSVDLSFAFFVIVFLWWLLIITWLVIKLSSKGSAIFAQQRIGKDGKQFTCYKFRTMNIGTKQAGTHEVAANNITKIGHFLRKTKIDELPQIWNILKNELSLVGPRPCLPMQKELITQRKKRGVFDVKPGITGWAQIKGVDMSDPKHLAELDAEYLDLQSLILDIKIILATIIGRGQGDKVRH